MSEYSFENIGPLRSDSPGLLSWAINARYFEQAMAKENLALLVCRPEDYLPHKDEVGFGVILSDDPQFSFFELHNKLIEEGFYGSAKPTVVRSAAVNGYVSPLGVEVGANTVINVGAVLKDAVTIGGDGYIESGAVLGVEGMRRVYSKDGSKYLYARHGGGIAVGNNVHVGANAVIVRSVWVNPWTTIEDDVYIGQLVNVAHNCHIKRGAILLPGATLCGHSIIGEHAWIGPNATIREGVTIGDGARVSMGSVVTQDVPAGATYTGNFAIPHSDFIANLKAINERNQGS